MIEYTIQNFNGPLDLLLQLIEKNKFDIFDIPVLELTDQYISYIERYSLDPDECAEFLVMAASLIEMKARLLLPLKEDEEDYTDPKKELEERLIEYRRFKEASLNLKDLETEEAFQRERNIPLEIQKYKAEFSPSEIFCNIGTEDLKNIYEDVLRRKRNSIDRERSSFRRVKRESYSIREIAKSIVDRLRKYRSMTFDKFAGRKTKTERIADFLTVLELCKTGILSLSQEKPFGEVEISLKDMDPEKIDVLEEFA